jgi:hypothetical protein
MKETPPNVGNFVKSLRDVGYTFEIAVADVLDNSISANSTEIFIHTVANPEHIFCMLDNGDGMTDAELIRAMRLASISPEDKREKNDLGRFGLGLKTASFSQCKKLTVLSKKNGVTSIKQWDLDFISEQNKWMLITPNEEDFVNIPLYKEFNHVNSGTLVVWQSIDRYQKDKFSSVIEQLRSHLSLVFHRFLESENRFKKLKILVNNNQLKPFNPFNASHSATNEKPPEKIIFFGSAIMVTPYILPHHSKVSSQEWDEYSTEDGYIKSQGFYLYRANRLLIYGTWWGLHKATDAHKLVRIKIDIPNDQDKYWGIDIKKSHAKPCSSIKKDLKRIINEVVKIGSRTFTGRGKKIIDKNTTRFWEVIPIDKSLRFGLNKNHPFYEKIKEKASPDVIFWLNTYLKGVEAYLPLEAIQSQLQQNPHELKQADALSQEDINELVMILKKEGLSSEYIDSLQKTEIFKNNKEILT